MSIVTELQVTASARQRTAAALNERLDTLTTEARQLRTEIDAADLTTADLDELGRAHMRLGLVEREIGRVQPQATQATQAAEQARRDHQDVVDQLQDTERVLFNLSNTGEIEVLMMSLQVWAERIVMGRAMITKLTGRTTFAPISFTV